jgi:hypothetical protein
MPLSNANKLLFNSLNRSNVSTTLSGSKRFAKDARWLGRNNLYRTDAAEKVESDASAGTISNPRHLAQYISVSSLLHCSDGWSYLGRAVQALLRGDPHRARHLAYYAELRATMSLLASEGIGVFNGRHALIDSPNSAVAFPSHSNTHVFVWECLDYWAQHQRSGDLFSSVIRPYGRSLSDWLLPINGQANLGAQANSWFMQWGMDLQQMAADRRARNHSSYRPEGIPNSWTLSSLETTQTVANIWRALEPAPNSAFDLVDRHILRLSLESIHRSRTGASTVKGTAFNTFVSSVIAYQNLSTDLHGLWAKFLTRQTEPEDAHILQLSKKAPTASAKSSFYIVARAVLLLRVASGSTSALFRDAGFSSSEIEFWWTELGPARGLWNSDGAPENKADLWSDIDNALMSLSDFENEFSGSRHSFYNLGNTFGDAVSSVSGFERAMIWSLLPA